MSCNMPTVRLHTCFYCGTCTLLCWVILIFKLIVWRILAVINYHRRLLNILEFMRISFLHFVRSVRSGMRLCHPLLGDSSCRLSSNFFAWGHVLHLDILLTILLWRGSIVLLIEILWTSTPLKHGATSSICTWSPHSMMNWRLQCVVCTSAYLKQLSLIIEELGNFL